MDKRFDFGAPVLYIDYSRVTALNTQATGKQGTRVPCFPPGQGAPCPGD